MYLIIIDKYDNEFLFLLFDNDKNKNVIKKWVYIKKI